MSDENRTTMTTTTQARGGHGGRTGGALALALALVGLASPACQPDDALTQAEYDRRGQAACSDVCDLDVQCRGSTETRAECVDDCVMNYLPADVDASCAQTHLFLIECLAAAESCEDFEARNDSDNEPSGPCAEAFRRDAECLNSIPENE